MENELQLALKIKFHTKEIVESQTYLKIVFYIAEGNVFPEYKSSALIT